METHDNGLPSLPDDIIREILALLDMEALKSYSLTCRTLSYSAKPFLHRALHVTPRFEGLAEPSDPSRRTELEGLRVLSERGLLQHTRHLSISLGLDPLFIHDLEPYIQQLRTLANLRSLKTRWLDTPSFITKTGEYFGAFLGTLQSLELESPRGDHKQILYFVCQFRDLQDLKINNLQDYSHSVHNGDPNLDTNTSPPFNGTLDLNLVNTGSTSIDSKGGQLILGDLLKLPSGLKFRTLKLSGCVANNLQLLVDACGPTLEELTAPYDVGSHRPRLSFKCHPRFRKLRIKLAESPTTEGVAGWLSETLSTVTSSVFTKLTISITLMAPTFGITSEKLREWNSVDHVLDQLDLCENVTLVLRPRHWVVLDRFRVLTENYFPLMWKKGRVVLEEQPATMEDVMLKWIQNLVW